MQTACYRIIDEIQRLGNEITYNFDLSWHDKERMLNKLRSIAASSNMLFKLLVRDANAYIVVVDGNTEPESLGKTSNLKILAAPIATVITSGHDINFIASCYQTLTGEKMSPFV